jgi:hypothetical protein
MLTATHCKRWAVQVYLDTLLWRLPRGAGDADELINKGSARALGHHHPLRSRALSKAKSWSPQFRRDVLVHQSVLKHRISHSLTASTLSPTSATNRTGALSRALLQLLSRPEPDFLYPPPHSLSLPTLSSSSSSTQPDLRRTPSQWLTRTAAAAVMTTSACTIFRPLDR